MLELLVSVTHNSNPFPNTLQAFRKWKRTFLWKLALSTMHKQGKITLAPYILMATTVLGNFPLRAQSRFPPRFTL